jgi:hypothetical protein
MIVVPSHGGLYQIVQFTQAHCGRNKHTPPNRRPQANERYFQLINLVSSR